MPIGGHDPFDNPRLLVEIVESQHGCEIFAACCESGADTFARITGLERVHCDKSVIISHESLFWEELTNIGPTGEPFLVAGALYRFLCITRPFRLVRAGTRELLHPVVAQHTNAAVAFRLCYELGEALITRVMWIGQPIGFERYILEYAAAFLAETSVPSAADAELRFNMIFSGRLAAN